MNPGSKIPQATLGIVVTSPAKRKFSNLCFPNQELGTVGETKIKKRKKRHDESILDLTTNQREKKILYLGGSQTKLQTSFGTFSLGRIAEDKDSDQSALVKCNECNREVKQKSFKSHLKTHLGLKHFECELCGDKFTRRNDVKRHTRLIHDKPREFQCEVCQKYFISNESLTSHIPTHETEFNCHICSHKFEKKEHYEDHVKILHSSQENLVTNYKSQKPSKIMKIKTEEELEPTSCLPLDLSKKSLEDQVPGLGQLVQKDDGTFEVVNNDQEDDDGHKVGNNEAAEESPDAVQTLINAVQELIQTHEDTNLESSKANKI